MVPGILLVFHLFNSFPLNFPGNLPGQPPSPNDQFTKRENIKTVPFFIQDNSSTKIFVKAIGPTEPNLDAVSYREERAGFVIK